MKDYYHEEKEFALAGIEKDIFISAMCGLCNDDEVTHYMVNGLYPGNREQIGKLYDDAVSGRHVVFAVIDKKARTVYGFVGLYEIQWQPRFAEFRIILDRKLWGRGIGTAIAVFVVSYAFERLNLNKVWLGVNEENKRALQSYEKAGFKKEGVLREEVYRNNRYYNAIRMSILRSDYEHS